MPIFSNFLRKDEHPVFQACFSLGNSQGDFWQIEARPSLPISPSPQHLRFAAPLTERYRPSFAGHGPPCPARWRLPLFPSPQLQKAGKQAFTRSNMVSRSSARACCSSTLSSFCTYHEPRDASRQETKPSETEGEHHP